MPRCIIVPGIDRLVMNMRAVASETGDFLNQTALGVVHQLPVTAIPQFIAVTNAPSHSTAGGFYGVLRHELRVERWQLAMPVDDL